MLHTALIWGWTGTGKTLFPKSLHQALLHWQLPYSLLALDFTKILCRREGAESEVLTQTKETCQGTRPLLLALQHAELVVPVDEVLEPWHAWLTDWLQNGNCSAGVVVLAITSSPDRIHPTLRNLFKFTAYYDLPTRQTARELLAVRGVQDAEIVTNHLYDKAEHFGVRFTGRGLLNGVDMWLARATTSGMPPEEHRPKDIAKMIFACSAGVDKKDIESYLDESLVLESHSFTESWTQRFRQLVDAGELHAKS